jgi:hypothetical protein
MMKLVRSPDMPEAADYTANEKRYSVVLRAELDGDDIDAPVSVRIVNISAGGLMAVVPPGRRLDGQVTMTIRHLGRFAGRIVWARDGRIGMKFDAAIDPEKLMTDRAKRAAASARSAARFVEESSCFFSEQDSNDALPFVTMMQSMGTAGKIGLSE